MCIKEEFSMLKILGSIPRISKIVSEFVAEVRLKLGAF